MGVAVDFSARLTTVLPPDFDGSQLHDLPTMGAEVLVACRLIGCRSSVRSAASSPPASATPSLDSLHLGRGSGGGGGGGNGNGSGGGGGSSGNGGTRRALRRENSSGSLFSLASDTSDMQLSAQPQRLFEVRRP